MTFDLGETINNFSNYLINESMFSRLLRNPIGSTFLILIIIIIILMLNYKDEIYDDQIKAIRVSIYLFVFILCYLFLHYKSLANLFEYANENKVEKQIVEEIANTEEEIKPFTQPPVLQQPPQDINFNDYIL